MVKVGRKVNSKKYFDMVGVLMYMNTKQIH
jgi:hypothetical protein